jgi:hypothetical protein
MLHSISWKQFIEFIAWAAVVYYLLAEAKTLLKAREVRP